jgi:hypothetical protein
VPAPEKKSESRLDEVLRQWARAADARRSVSCRFTLTELDRTFEERKVSKAQALVQPPDRLRVDVLHKGRPSFILVLTGKAIHVFNFASRVEAIYPRPKDGTFLGAQTRRRTFREKLNGLVRGECYQQQLAWLIAGLPVRDLPARFDVQLVKEDQWYAYLQLRPRRSKEREDVQRMRVVLNKDGWWVRQIWLLRPNDNETTFDFEQARVVDKPPITAEAIRRHLPKETWTRRTHSRADELPGPEKER